MLGLIVRRLLHAVPLLVGVVAVLFALLQTLPGDPVQAIVGMYPVPEAYRESIIEQFHLNDSLAQRFWTYLIHVAQGDLGYSYAGGQSVSGLIFERLPNTLLLVGVGMAISAIVGIAAGGLSAMTGRQGVDGGVNLFVLTAFAVPSFWLGQLLILFLAVRLGWFPTQGMSPLVPDTHGLGVVWERIWYLTLPVIALCAREMATVTRVFRASMRETVTQDYIVTAELKGLSRRAIVARHVLKNSMLPVVTVLGYRFGVALAGTVLIERIFAWPGVGSLLLQSIEQRDNQVIVGIVLVVAVIVILVNLVTDLVYEVLDPRIRRSAA